MFYCRRMNTRWRNQCTTVTSDRCLRWKRTSTRVERRACTSASTKFSREANCAASLEKRNGDATPDRNRCELKSEILNQKFDPKMFRDGTFANPRSIMGIERNVVQAIFLAFRLVNTLPPLSRGCGSAMPKRVAISLHTV